MLGLEGAHQIRQLSGGEDTMHAANASAFAIAVLELFSLPPHEWNGTPLFPNTLCCPSPTFRCTTS